MRLFVFGLGYAAGAVARALQGQAAIAGTGREPRPGLHLFDGTAPGPTLGADLAAATHVLVSIPPGPEGDPVLACHRPGLDAAPLDWLCYFSTVGVYGDAGGAVVNEKTPPRPANARSRWRLAAEDGWRAYADRRGVPLAVIRLAGIYGPGRSAFERLSAGTARRIVKPGQVFNRIHVADIGRITARAAQVRLAGTFNLADEEPAPPQDVVALAAVLLGVPAPPEEPFETAGMTPMARSFYSDNKRVDAGAIRRALGIGLLFPTYREGLEAIRAGGG
jgi:nucleoside-diphosphate-sugar epimerase